MLVRFHMQLAFPAMSLLSKGLVVSAMVPLLSTSPARHQALAGAVAGPRADVPLAHDLLQHPSHHQETGTGQITTHVVITHILPCAMGEFCFLSKNSPNPNLFADHWGKPGGHLCGVPCWCHVFIHFY